jgi:RNA-directed DNA polymerase
MSEAKPFCISKWEVWEAYKRVKANQGAAGVDEQSIEDFERNLQGNLYKIWNRMSSGSYFPSPVRTVKIPKANGGERKLGIPTVSDRIAQQVVKSRLEPAVDPLFHPDSYGYRPGKSALDAVGQARQRCWRYDWIVDLDIKGFFDNIPQDLLVRAVKKHAKEQWMVLYIERWLKAPVQEEDGQLVPREKGTPQGGVMTPRTQKIISSLNAGSAFCGSRVRVDLCRIWLYVYDRCHVPASRKEPSASIVRGTSCSMSIILPMR